MKISNNHVTNSSGINYIVTNMSDQTKTLWDFVCECVDNDIIYNNIINEKSHFYYQTNIQDNTKEELKNKIFFNLVEDMEWEDELDVLTNAKPKYTLSPKESIVLMASDESDDFIDLFISYLNEFVPSGKTNSFNIKESSNSMRRMGRGNPIVAIYKDSWYF